MPITRDQATRVLTQPEMTLFGDSRNPALRALSEKALASRVERTRKLRDKSRDLLQRQKLKSRQRTGSKLGTSGVANQRTEKKGDILEDILQRFESRLEETQAAAEAATKTRTTSSAIPAKQASIKRATAKRVPAEKSASAAKDGSVKGNEGAKPKPTRKSGKTSITPERALDNTRALLEAKHQRDRQTPAYLAIDTHAGAEQPSPGFQSGAAKSRALELHEGEMRMEPIHGSVSTHNRINQGKRDKG